MPFDAVKNGWGPVERDESNGETAANDGHLITMDGVTYSKGIGMHAAGEIVVPLDDEYSTFKASIGIDDETIPHVGRADIEIWGDGKELASTGTVKTGEKAVNLIVNVTGVEYLSIVAKEVGGNNYYAHVDLGYARVYPVTNTNITGVDAPASSALPVPVTTSVVSSSSTFLSDMPMTQISNGFGNAQRDLADGGMDSAGGTPLTIDGTVYNKGLGVNADSDLQFSLNGDYKTFSSEIGIDDESGGQGAVDFEVLADGKLIYNSGMVLGGQAATPISLNVSGVKTLDLVVVNAQDGIDYDNADWVDAQVST
jgi:hypothetical protein